MALARTLCLMLLVRSVGAFAPASSTRWTVRGTDRLSATTESSAADEAAKLLEQVAKMRAEAAAEEAALADATKANQERINDMARAPPHHRRRVVHPPLPPHEPSERTYIPSLVGGRSVVTRLKRPCVCRRGRQIFAELDLNNDGMIDVHEMHVALTRHGVNVSEDVVKRVIAKFDDNSDGVIQVEHANKLTARSLASLL